MQQETRIELHLFSIHPSFLFPFLLISLLGNCLVPNLSSSPSSFLHTLKSSLALSSFSCIISLSSLAILIALFHYSLHDFSFSFLHTASLQQASLLSFTCLHFLLPFLPFHPFAFPFFFLPSLFFFHCYDFDSIIFSHSFSIQTSDLKMGEKS